jgi:hypothetical protein
MSQQAGIGPILPRRRLGPDDVACLVPAALLDGRALLGGGQQLHGGGIYRVVLHAGDVLALLELLGGGQGLVPLGHDAAQPGPDLLENLVDPRLGDAEVGGDVALMPAQADDGPKDVAVALGGGFAGQPLLDLLVFQQFFRIRRGPGGGLAGHVVEFRLG